MDKFIQSWDVVYTTVIVMCLGIWGYISAITTTQKIVAVLVGLVGVVLLLQCGVKINISWR